MSDRQGCHRHHRRRTQLAADKEPERRVRGVFEGVGIPGVSGHQPTPALPFDPAQDTGHFVVEQACDLGLERGRRPSPEFSLSALITGHEPSGFSSAPGEQERIWDFVRAGGGLIGSDSETAVARGVGYVFYVWLSVSTAAAIDALGDEAGELPESEGEAVVIDAIDGDGTIRIATRPRDGGVRLEVSKGDMSESLEADVALIAIGRAPVTAGLGLEALGLVPPRIGRAPLVDVDPRHRRGIRPHGPAQPGEGLSSEYINSGDAAMSPRAISTSPVLHATKMSAA